MADTETTGQAGIDAETARNAADILSIIADYENEVDTIVGETEDYAGAEPSKGTLGQTQPATPVPATEPPQAVNESTGSEAAPTQPSEQTSTEPELDAQAEILRLQLERTKKLQQDAAAAMSEAQAEETVTYLEPLEQAPVVPEAITEQPHSPSQDLTLDKEQPAQIETATAAASQQEREVFMSMFEDIRSELRSASEQRQTFAQQLTASQARLTHLEHTAESTPRVSPSSTTVPAVPKPTVSPVDEPVIPPVNEPASVQQNTDNQVLTQILAAQSDLAQEIKAIKCHMAKPTYSKGIPIETIRQPESYTLNTLAAELTRMKSHVQRLEHGRMPLSNPMGAYTKPTPPFGRHDTVITQQIQDLHTQLEQTYSEQVAMAQTLAQANQTTQCLQDRINQQDNALVEKSQQLNSLYVQRENETAHLHAQLSNQTEALSQANQALHEEISQRKEVERMLRDISSQFQPCRY